MYAALQAELQSLEDFEAVLHHGRRQRAVGTTDMNSHSSRSHLIVRLSVSSVHIASGDRFESSIFLVDLAGSERLDRSAAVGDRLKETQHINKSLSALGDVIASLQQQTAHIPFRNSKLTLLLSSGLSGRARALVVMHVSSLAEDYGETLCTLKFAQRVSAVQMGKIHRQVESANAIQSQEHIIQLQRKVEALQRSLQHEKHQQEKAKTSALIHGVVPVRKPRTSRRTRMETMTARRQQNGSVPAPELDRRGRQAAPVHKSHFTPTSRASSRSTGPAGTRRTAGSRLSSESVGTVQADDINMRDGTRASPQSRLVPVRIQRMPRSAASPKKHSAGTVDPEVWEDDSAHSRIELDSDTDDDWVLQEPTPVKSPKKATSFSMSVTHRPRSLEGMAAPPSIPPAILGDMHLRAVVHPMESPNTPATPPTPLQRPEQHNSRYHTPPVQRRSREDAPKSSARPVGLRSTTKPRKGVSLARTSTKSPSVRAAISTAGHESPSPPALSSSGGIRISRRRVRTPTTSQPRRARPAADPVSSVKAPGASLRGGRAVAGGLAPRVRGGAKQAGVSRPGLELAGRYSTDGSVGPFDDLDASSRRGSSSSRGRGGDDKPRWR